jgi:hypothetical protein
MRGQPGRKPGRWPVRTASWLVGCAARRCGWWIVPGSSARRYGRSPEPWPGAPASYQIPSWSSTHRQDGSWPIDRGGTSAGRQGARRGAWPERPRQATRRPTAGGADQPLPAHRHPDPAAIAGEKITDRLVSLADPGARPIRKGKLGKPNEFGYVAHPAGVTANTRRGTRGYVLPAASAPGNPGENRLLAHAAELDRLGLRPREVALVAVRARPDLTDPRRAWRLRAPFISGRAEPGPYAPACGWPATAPAHGPPPREPPHLPRLSGGSD